MICAIVLAAGRSERMGTQKLLLPLEGKPLIGVIVDELLSSPVQRVLVVVGRDAERIQTALADRAVTFVNNAEVNGDMLSSVRCGLRALPAGCAAVMVALGDQPGITQNLVKELIVAYEKADGGIVLPAYQNRRGHPVLFAVKYRDEILMNFDGEGLHGLLDAHADEIVRVDAKTSKALADLDTPEDYQYYLKSISS
jgi:molybdenum cofactor cytidylyltransferase